jgi:hypothetical protein
LLESNVISGPDIDDKVLHLKAPASLDMPDLFVELPKNPDECNLTYTAVSSTIVIAQYKRANFHIIKTFMTFF